MNTKLLQQLQNKLIKKYDEMFGPTFTNVDDVEADADPSSVDTPYTTQVPIKLPTGTKRGNTRVTEAEKKKDKDEEADTDVDDVSADDEADMAAAAGEEAAEEATGEDEGADTEDIPEDTGGEDMPDEAGTEEMPTGEEGGDVDPAAAGGAAGGEMPDEAGGEMGADMGGGGDMGDMGAGGEMGGDMGGMGGMGEQEEEKTSSEIGRIYELKKIYSRLTSIESYLGDESAPDLLEIRNYVSQAIELFEVVSSNFNSYKDKLDEIIITYYKFVLEVYKEVKDFYSKQSKTGDN